MTTTNSISGFSKTFGARRKARASNLARILPLTVLTLSLFVPAQFYVDIGSFRLTAYRIVLFLILPFLVSRLLNSRTSLKSYDIAIFFVGLWVVAAMSFNHGIEQGLESGGIIAFETIAGYLAARLYLTDRQAIVSFVKLLTVGLMLAACTLLFEIAAGRRLIYEVTSWISGNPVDYSDENVRFGLIRANGPFAHPIHAGVFMITMISFAWLTTTLKSKRFFRTGLLGAGMLATLSSAPWLGGILQAGLIFYHGMCNRFRIRNEWTFFFLALAAVILFLEFASNRGAIKFLAISLSLDPHTAYYRILIWTFGIENVMDNPVFGIGYGDWERADWMASSSIDAFWLVIALRHGLPAAALLGYASVSIFWQIAKVRPKLNAEGSRYALATMITLFALVLVGFTVHYWGNIYILYLLIHGLGGSLAAGALQERNRPKYRRSRPEPRARLTTNKP